MALPSLPREAQGPAAVQPFLTINTTTPAAEQPQGRHRGGRVAATAAALEGIRAGALKGATMPAWRLLLLLVRTRSLVAAGACESQVQLLSKAATCGRL